MKVLWLSPLKIHIHTFTHPLWLTHTHHDSLSLFKMTKPNSFYMQMRIEANNLEKFFKKLWKPANKHKLAIN